MPLVREEDEDEEEEKDALSEVVRQSLFSLSLPHTERGRQRKKETVDFKTRAAK